MFSDSSKYVESQASQEFDSHQHLIDLSQEYKVALSGVAYISYPYGWRYLIRDFMESVKKYPVLVGKVVNCRGCLQIKFEMTLGKNEIQVWRLVESTQIKALKSCMECGSLGELTNIPTTNQWICESCYKSIKQEKTGTWLDKY